MITEDFQKAGSFEQCNEATLLVQPRGDFRSTITCVSTSMT